MNTTTPSPPSFSPKRSKSRFPLIRIILVLCIIVGLFYLYAALPVDDWVTWFRTYIQGHGILGWFIFIAVYAVVCFALIPGSLLTLAAGLIWGLGGFPIVIVGATLGSSLSFLAARYLFHNRVQSRVKQYPRFGAINDAIGEEGWRVVLLLRLSPALPFSLQNWFLGITPVSFWSSQLATFLGIMPGTLAYVWLGSLGGHIADSTETGYVKMTILGVGLLATILVTVIITRTASQKLKEYQNS